MEKEWKSSTRQNKKYLVVFGIFALVIVTTAASFAFFTYSRVGNTTTTVTSGDIEFTYKEGEDAGLANAFPVSDTVGAQDTTKEYTFTVNIPICAFLLFLSLPTNGVSRIFGTSINCG